MTVTGFEYTPELCERFPAATAALVLVDGIDNSTCPASLADEYRQVQRAVRERLDRVPIAEHESIRAWRAVFTELGVKPTRYRNAAEALLRRLQRHGDLPSINPIVDIGNIVSISHALPVAVFDADRIDGVMHVTYASGGETFEGIGASELETPATGEVIFIDDAEHVAARRWCWKQGATTAAQADSTTALLVVEAVHADRAGLDDARADLEQLVARHLPDARIDGAQVSSSVQRATFAPPIQ